MTRRTGEVRDDVAGRIGKPAELAGRDRRILVRAVATGRRKVLHAKLVANAHQVADLQRVLELVHQVVDVTKAPTRAQLVAHEGEEPGEGGVARVGGSIIKDPGAQ